jgi:MFS family permease
VKRQPAIGFILVTVLIDVMGIGLLLPVIPGLVGEFTTSRDTQTYWYGALMVTFGLMQFLCAPLLGALSDRYGRRPVLLASIAGLGTMFFLSAVVTSLPALLATRIFGGALAANFSVANAYVADITTPEDRARSFGKIGAAFGIGFIFGPGWAACWVRSTSGCRFTPPPCCRWPIGAMDFSFCPSRCRANAAKPSTGGAPTRFHRWPGWCASKASACWSR